MRHLVWLIGLLAMAGASGCGTVISDVRTVRTGVILDERGEQKRLLETDAEATAYFFLMRQEWGRTGPYVLEKPLDPWVLQARGYPFERYVYGIQGLANDVVPIGGDLERLPAEVPVRWVIGNVPLVLAIGTESVPVGKVEKSSYGGYWNHAGRVVRLVTERDLDATAVELVVLDEWPKDERYSSFEERVAFQKMLAERCRRIRLPKPTRLREILDRRLWEIPVRSAT